MIVEFVLQSDKLGLCKDRSIRQSERTNQPDTIPMQVSPRSSIVGSSTTEFQNEGRI